MTIEKIKNSYYITKPERYMNIALTISDLSKCIDKQVGCLLLDNDWNILSTGYNGPPKGFDHCKICQVKKLVDKTYLCMSIHAEINAMIKADMNKATILICTLFPCMNCLKVIANTHIHSIYYLTNNKPNNLIEEKFKRIIFTEINYERI